jgi:Family of unknown function (DUF5675)
MKVVISRSYGILETLGILYVFDGTKVTFNCYTIELPDEGNVHNISCIPEGEYDVVKINSSEHGDCFQVLNVPGRDGILIHVGNYAAGSQVDTKGCILVGSGFDDINNDGNLDVVNSKDTLDKLYNILPDGFKLYII